MKQKAKWIAVASILTTQVGCSNNDSEPEVKLSSKETIASIEVVEGSPFSISDISAVDLAAVEGEVYAKHADNTLVGIAPGVDEDKSIYIPSGETEVIELKIKNKAIPTIPDSTRPYAFSSANISKYDNYLTDNNRIPLVNIGDEKVHYPVTVSKYAHDLYANYLKTLSVEVQDEFIHNADWLRDNCEYTSYGFCSWRTKPAYTPYETGTDWASAMAQGQAISVLISAASITQDESYIKVAQDAVAAFYYPGSLKGVNSQWDEHLWYEEYTSENPARVLNGFLFSMAGLYDAVELLNDESAQMLWTEGLKALESKLHLYDADFTSLYDNDEIKRFANAKTSGLDGYHELHILQLGWLYQVTNNEIYKQLFNKFLAVDIGSFRSRNIKSMKSQKIENIVASHSVRADTNGPEFLYDRNWTYGNYWSTHRNGTFLDIELNGLKDSPGISCLMMSARQERYFPKSFDLYTSDSAGQLSMAVSAEQVSEIQAIDNKWVYKDKESIARTYCFEQTIPSSNKIRIVTYLGESSLIAIRELDVHFRRPAIEEELLEIYKSWRK